MNGPNKKSYVKKSQGAQKHNFSPVKGKKKKSQQAKLQTNQLEE